MLCNGAPDQGGDRDGAAEVALPQAGGADEEPGGGIPAWLLSHPHVDERIAAIEANEARWAGVGKFPEEETWQIPCSRNLGLHAERLRQPVEPRAFQELFQCDGLA